MVDVVLPFHGRAELVIACLRSLERHWYGNGRIILVDDASPRLESALVSAAIASLGLPVEWMSNLENRGYLGSINEGARRCTQPFIVLLNSDTILPPECLGKLCAVLEQCDWLGAVAPVSDNRSDLFQFRGPGATPADWIARERAHRVSCPPAVLPEHTILVPYVTSMCLCVRNDLFRRLGYLDPAYGRGYFEDFDLCCRIRACGFQLAIREDCLVHHEGQGTHRFFPSILGTIPGNFALFEARWGHLPEHQDLLRRLRATLR